MKHLMKRWFAGLVVWAMCGLGSWAATVPPVELRASIDTSTGGILLVATGPAGSSQVLERSVDLVRWHGLRAGLLTGGRAEWILPLDSGTAQAFRLRPADTTEAANPISVTPRVNSDFVRTIAVTRAGVSSTLTDDNGVTYQLVIPPNAVLAEEDLVFSVVNTVTGWPLSGKYLGGITLEPAGILFQVPATLTITLPAAPVRPLGVSWRTGGAEFQAVPILVSGPTRVVLGMGRTGGYGLADAAVADATLLGNRNPSDLLAQDLHQQALGALAGTSSVVAGPGSRAGLQKAGASTAWMSDEAIARVQARFDRLQRPRFEAAIQDDSLADRVLAEYSAWEFGLMMGRSAADQALLAPIVRQAMDLGAQVIYTGLNRAGARCERHDLQSLGRMIHFGQLMETAPWSAGFTPVDLKVFRQKVKNCASFDLDLDADLSYRSTTFHGTSRVHTHWAIAFRDEALTQLTGEGQAPLEATFVEDVPLPTCGVVGPNPSPGGVRIPEFHLVPNARDMWSLTNRPSAKTISLLINPFLVAPKENVHILCTLGAPPPDIVFEDFWSYAFGRANQSRLTRLPQGQIFKITGWKDGSDGILGEIQDNTIIASDHITFDLKVKWTLSHYPIPF